MRFRRAMAVVLVIGLGLLLLVATLSHQHDEATPSDREDSCLICQIQEELYTTVPPSPLPLLIATPFVAFYLYFPHVEPRTVFVVRASSSRAPPLIFS